MRAPTLAIFVYCVDRFPEAGLAEQMRQVFNRHFGPDWPMRCGQPGFWEAIDAVDDGELWETHQTLKSQLIDTARRRAVQYATARGESPAFITLLRRALSLDALTIGFARRFATYKRANLLLQDLEALIALVNHPQRPVQFIFAGKAHPHDSAGKDLLQQVARLMQDPQFAGKLLFLEDYDINVGRHLVQGVDVWVNNPRRPLEACGTSGQKVVLNGGLNLSILDGWWAEAYDGLNGFAIGGGETHTSLDVHDRRATPQRCWRTLRDEVIPLYYERDRDGLPRALDRPHQARHSHARLALQRRSHGHGLCREGLHPRGWRDEQRSIADSPRPAPKLQRLAHNGAGRLTGTWA